MIGELVELYDRLVEEGAAPDYGYSMENVPFGLEIDDDGTIIQTLIFGSRIKEKSKKHMMAVPAHALRTVKIQANFLCDNASYMLGEDVDGKNDKAARRFAAAAELHARVLAGAEDKDSRAVVAFFQKGSQADLVKEQLGDDDWRYALTSNFVLCREAKPLSENAVMKKYWNVWFSEEAEPSEVEDKAEKNKKWTPAPTMQSVVSGVSVVPAVTHPNIKGVYKAQSSGAALISFNAPAYCSYGKEQDLNAPMSKREAFSYTTALNTMLKDDHYHTSLNDGSLTIVCWAESGFPEYSEAAMGSIGQTNGIGQADLIGIVTSISKGKAIDFHGVTLNPNEHFYIMGLAPNAARLSVSFFLKDTFGDFMQNVQHHYEDLEIIRPKYEKEETVPVWKLLEQTVPKHTPGAKRVSASPRMVADLLKAVLTGSPYPTSLFNSVETRVQIEHEINRTKAAIIKAYFLRHPNDQCPKEVLRVSINKESTNVPYVLGRLFAIYEGIQHAANPEINTTIGDKFFTNASAMPAVIFPRLGNLAKKHMRKLSPAASVYYTKQIATLMEKIGDSFPSRLSLPEQGSFQLGYYFETQERFKGKDQETNGEGAEDE